MYELLSDKIKEIERLNSGLKLGGTIDKEIQEDVQNALKGKLIDELKEIELEIKRDTSTADQPNYWAYVLQELRRNIL